MYHLLSDAYFVEDDSGIDDYLLSLELWFNAAVSSNQPWVSQHNGSGYVGQDKIVRFINAKMHDRACYRFFGIPSSSYGCSHTLPPFCLSVSVVRRFGSAVICVLSVNGNGIPFSNAALNVALTGLAKLKGVELIREKAVVGNGVYLDSFSLPSERVWIPINRHYRIFGFWESMYRDVCDMCELERYLQEMKQLRWETKLQAFVPGTAVLHYMPDELKDQEFRAVGDEWKHPFSIALTAAEKDVDEFLASVAGRFNALQAVEQRNELMLQKGIRQRPLKTKGSRRRMMKATRDHTKYMAKVGELQSATMSFAEAARTMEHPEEEDSEKIIKARQTFRMITRRGNDTLKRILHERFVTNGGKSVFDIQDEDYTNWLGPKKGLPEIEQPFGLQIPGSGFDFISSPLINADIYVKSYRATLASALEDNEGLTGPSLDGSDVKAASDEKDLLRDALDHEKAVSGQLREQLSNAEEQLFKMKAEYEAQKLLADHLALKLKEKGQSSSADEKVFDTLAAVIADENSSITADEALSAAEVLSNGCMVVLPSAHRSAEAVPVEFAAGRRLLMLLVRLSRLWLPLYLEKGDNAARGIFTPNCYSAQDSVRLSAAEIRTRIFTYQGREEALLKHLKIGVAMNQAHTLRVYFDCIDGKVVVGWCGEHLPLTKAQ